MKIEILFPEFCNLFGDMSNMRYLEKCLPNAEFIETPFEAEPIFLTQTVGLIYLGPMTERTQEKVIEKFRPYKDRINELIESGTVFLFTGNAFEIFGEYIENEDGSRIPGLQLFAVHAVRDMMNRHNSTFLGKFEDCEVMGFKSQFTLAYSEPNYRPFLQVEKGTGMNKTLKTEGICYKNFIGTYLLGPLLILNPQFTKKLLVRMGIQNPTIAFEAAVTSAYEKRLIDFKAKT